MAHRRLLWQLFPSFLLITFSAVIVIIVYSYFIIGEIYLQVKSSDLESRIQLTENQIVSLLVRNEFTKIDSLCKDLGKRSQTRFTVILSDGVVVADSDENPAHMDNHLSRPEIKQSLEEKTGTSVRYSQTMNSEFIYVAKNITRKSQTVCVIRAAVPLTFLGQTLQVFKQRFLTAGLLITAVIALVSLLVSRNISKPLESMLRGIGRFSEGELSFRLARSGSFEMARLTEALNQMAAQLDEKMKAIIRGKSEQQAVLEGMIESVLALDTERRIININQAAARLFQLDSMEVIGTKIEQIIHHEELHTIIGKIFMGTAPVESEIIISQKEEFHLQVHGSVIRDAQEQVIGAVIVLNDVTRLRRLEKVRRDFVANVSHEIRTPLTSIKGFAETLLSGAIEEPETARGFVQIISNQSNRLNAIIEDLLILARLEQKDNRIFLKFRKYAVKQVIEDAIKLCKPKADAKNILLDFRPENDISIKMNPDLIEQALVNLIDNAIKYSTDHSMVSITMQLTGEMVRITVADQGPGIHKKNLPRLFERFYRVDKARSRNLGGTGLGLAIVKHIAQVHQGFVKVESEPGRGSTFFIQIPLKK